MSNSIFILSLCTAIISFLGFFSFFKKCQNIKLDVWFFTKLSIYMPPSGAPSLPLFMASVCVCVIGGCGGEGGGGRWLKDQVSDLGPICPSF